MAPTPVPLRARFWAHVQLGHLAPPHAPALGPCWQWAGYRDGKGYGMVAVGGNRSTYAHRAAYELTYGPIPAGLEIDHLCRSRGCVRPSHLEAVPHQVNSARAAVFRQYRRLTHCQRGHEFTDANTYHRLGHRYCRACGNWRQRQRWHRRRATAQRHEAAS